MSRKPPDTDWRFMQNIRPRPWSTHNHREVHDLDNERADCELDEDFKLGNLRYLRIENSPEALETWLDDNPSHNACPYCVSIGDYVTNIIEPPDQTLILYVDRRRLLELLLSLVAIPSPGFAESSIATYLAEFVNRIGFDVELQHVAYPASSGRGSWQPVIRWSAASAGPTILLMSHMDTYPPLEGWDHSPYEGRVQGGWVYGCGVQDGKGGIAAAVAAMMALKEAGLVLHGNVVLAPVTGQKVGNLGVRALLDSGLRPDWALDIQNTNLEVVTPAGPVDQRLIRTLGTWHKRIVGQKVRMSTGNIAGEIVDGALTGAAGIPTIVYGPGDGRAAGQWPVPNERIWIEDLVTAARIIALSVRDLLTEPAV